MDFIEAKHAAAREIALALGVPPMLLGIPGDNTFSNYAEANRTFWRNTVIPLATRSARSLGDWLSPAYTATKLTLKLDLDAVEALSPEREALWARLDKATFLTQDEKRAASGFSPLKTQPPKYNPNHDDRGRFDFAPAADVIPVANPFQNRITGGKPRTQGDGGGGGPKTPPWLPPEARTKVPKEWGAGEPNQKGDGWRWSDPASPKDSGVRIDKGDPYSSQPSQREDHVVVRRGGRIIGRDGNPLPGDGSLKENPELGHIPLSEWLKWPSPFSRN